MNRVRKYYSVDILELQILSALQVQSENFTSGLSCTDSTVFLQHFYFLSCFMLRNNHTTAAFGMMLLAVLVTCIA